MAEQSDEWNRHDYEADEAELSVYTSIPALGWAAIFVLSSPFYLFFSEHEDQQFRGFVASISIAIILTLVGILRPLTRKGTFWATLAAIALAHIGLVYFLPYTGEFRFGFALFPVALVDLYLCSRLIIYECSLGSQN